MRSHPATDDFGVPEVNRPRQRNCGSDAEPGGCTYDCPNIAGILYGVEDEDAKCPAFGDVVQPTFGDGSDGQDPLRTVGFCGGEEIRFADLESWYVSTLQGRPEVRATLRFAKLRSAESASNR